MNKLYTLILLFFVCSLTLMGAEMETEHISKITTPIILLKGSTIISQGTGFYYVRQDTLNRQVLFLVTYLNFF